MLPNLQSSNGSKTFKNTKLQSTLTDYVFAKFELDFSVQFYSSTLTYVQDKVCNEGNENSNKRIKHLTLLWTFTSLPSIK